MRILIISHMYPNSIHPNHGNFIHNHVKHLVREGCEVRVISPVPYAPKLLWIKPKWKRYGQIPYSDLIEGIPVYYPRFLTLPGAWNHGLTCYSMYMGLRKCVDIIMRDFGPEIIHTHTATYDGYVGLMLKTKYSLPLICSLRGSDIHTYPHYEPFTKYLTRKVLEESDLIMSVSAELKARALQIGNPKRDISILYNGCDIDFDSYSEECRNKNRIKLSIPQDDKVLIYIGSIQKDKGIYELINTFHKLINKYDKLHLILIGEGRERKNLENIINTTNNSKFHLLSSVPHLDITKWLKTADLFVYPSYNEGLPNAVLEAMACGLPVVATRVGGIPEVIIDGQNGILVDSMNEAQLYTAIDSLLCNYRLSLNMGIRGTEVIESKFSWSKNALQTIKQYKELLNAKN